MLSAKNIAALLSLPDFSRGNVQKIVNLHKSLTPSSPSELRDLLVETKVQIVGIRVPTERETSQAWDRAKTLYDRANKLGIKIIGINDSLFPYRLRIIPDPPILLYAFGNVDILSANNMVSVIGTREPTEYGINSAQSISRILAEKGAIIVSGLAVGCDTAAHKGCLQGKGQTVAVLAHGLDRIYPSQNRELAKEIVNSGGALISEYPPDTEIKPKQFVERDRLQSGLSDAVIVIETDIRGGTMHTVNYCLRQERKLFCLSHPQELSTHPKSAGNRMLIAQNKGKSLLPTSDSVDLLTSSFNHEPSNLGEIDAERNTTFTYTADDILKSDAEGLVNAVNCVGVMGKGIALQFRNKFSENFREYQAACDRGEVRPGATFIHKVNESQNPRFIINFPKSSIGGIKAGLKIFRMALNLWQRMYRN